MLPSLPAILEVRQAVRGWLASHPGPVMVALSGGADSLALTSAVAAEATDVEALVVDHGLQVGSAAVAATAAEHARSLGCARARVLRVSVGSEGGIEAAARRARYDALDAARSGAAVLVAHTLDDQAETVLLGLSRGSGPRSIAGMAPWDSPWGRPLLGVRRSVTRQVCAELGIVPFEDPHNTDPGFTRVRLRHEVLPLLEDVLGGGVAQALARTAAQLREDAAVLDDDAAVLLADARVGDDLDVTVLTDAPPAIRRRTLRGWMSGLGARALSDKQLRLVDDLVGDWRGQGGVAVSGAPAGARLVVARRHGRLAAELEWSLRSSRENP
ncbi:tRNA lysidine(34) synthetase TilS [Rhodococcus sp. G-MC3]|uniref:tRNA lysidine(34) synthetase TilS n=1 Tax=Rhodococcus sp. G-MC3 TaxID=3046209 RepID=UPI0024BB6E97|nr:tRNA lysidine(34) synthetase TilS [Rhodococcus sp. G-MC3]MDJ0393440.1 tRNA lysidine(34) synthetase TilS [Rhodococcus sp. G-MC3]